MNVIPFPKKATHHDDWWVVCVPFVRYKMRRAKHARDTRTPDGD